MASLAGVISQQQQCGLRRDGRLGRCGSELLPGDVQAYPDLAMGIDLDALPLWASFLVGGSFGGPASCFIA